ncbi:MAG: hypothetical protein HND57_06800 [Planctomycetes bacterium]|nr:hypothetical protein [Planctomycetota bacterium]
MIARIQGEIIEAPADGSVLIRVASVTLRVLVPSCAESSYFDEIGQVVELHTLFYIESVGQGNTLLPRLIGFRSPEARAFFELFTTVKGIGQRKALRALAAPVSLIAQAIADRNVKFLQSLPEIGKRTAETIVAELHGKVERFLTPASDDDGTNGMGGSSGFGGPLGATSMCNQDALNWSAWVPSEQREIADQALAVLLQLGENRQQAAMWIEALFKRSAQAAVQDEDATDAPLFGDAQDVVAAVYQNKA